MKFSFPNRRSLALEWDAREARVVVALRAASGSVEVEHAFTVDLRPRDAAQAAAQVNVGERIGAALAARGIARGELLVAVGRASIELRRLAVPPAPEEELPELVRFQAQRQFAGLDDDWRLDFVPLAAAGEQEGVLAAAIAPDLVRQIQAVCQAAGHEPRRLALRPFAAASLWRRQTGDADSGCVLLVDLLADEADLTVLVAGQIAFLRTVRLPAEGREPGNVSLVAEIRRTMGAAQNQLGGSKVDRVVVCGDRPEHSALKADIETSLALPVALFDPLEGLPLSPEVQSRRPEHPGRFAPLLGLVFDEAWGVRPDIDFLNPRRRPAPPSQRRFFSLAGAAAALVVLATFWGVQARLAALDGRLSDLNGEITRMNDLLKRADTKVKEAAELDAWSRGDLVWLDELRELAEKYPPASDLIVSQLSLSSQAARGGQVVLEGRAREASVFPEMVGPISDARRKVEFPAGSEDAAENAVYPWRFKQSLSLTPAEPVQASVAAGAGSATAVPEPTP